MRSIGRGIVVAVLLATVIAPRVAAQEVVPGSVTWVVDHSEKTITVTVKLMIYMGCSGNPFDSLRNMAAACSPATSFSAPPSQAMADQIKAGIEGVWNRGYRYKCYELKVVVDITVGASFDDIPFDRIGVRIDPSPGNVRGWVSDANPAHNPPSEDPTDRVIPDNDRDDPTTWGLSGGATAWAHEFGHILGLNDSYITERLPNGDVRSVPLDPANPDMMTHHEIGALNRASVNRLIKRNMHQLHDKVGKAVTDDDLNCDYKVDVASGANYYKGTKCNGPKGAWVINIYAAGGQGSAIGSLNWTIPKNAMTAAVTGSWSANLPPVTSTWDVTSFVTFVDAEPDSNAPPKLDMKNLTGTWTTTAPGGINNVQDFTAPAAIIELESGNFCRGQSQPPG